MLSGISEPKFFRKKGDKMEQTKKQRNIIKQSILFGLSILIMFFLNVAYVSIELYKSNISKTLLAKAEITQVEFAKIETLTNYAITIDTAFIILTIGSIVFMFLKKNRPKIKSANLFLLTFLIVLFVLNMVTARIFDAPIGNITQLLYIPIIIVFVVYIYLVIRNTSRKFEVEEIFK